MDKIKAFAQKNVAYCLMIILTFYGLILFVFGLTAGVYWSKCTWLYTHLRITPSQNPYDLSFYASAEQDFWFFLLIGLAASVITMRQPKEDNLTTKVNHFFPEVDPSSIHMRYLEKEINRKSCVATVVNRELNVTTVENDFFEVIVNTSTKLKNIHHNHSLDENNGFFQIVPDSTVRQSKKPWGTINCFTLDNKASGHCHLTGSKRLQEDEFECSYNINLEPKETGQLICNYSMWNDINEPLESTPAMFTKEYNLKIANSSSSQVSLSITCKAAKHDIDLKQGEIMSQSLSFRDIRPDEDVIVITLKRQ